MSREQYRIRPDCGTGPHFKTDPAVIGGYQVDWYDGRGHWTGGSGWFPTKAAAQRHAKNMAARIKRMESR